MWQVPTNHAYLTELSNKIDNVCSVVEKQRNVIIPTTVRSFVASMIIESVVIRGNDWRNKHQIDVNNSTELLKTVSPSLDSVSTLFRNAPSESFDDNEYITLLGVAESIHRKWCGIFPFCR